MYLYLPFLGAKDHLSLDTFKLYYQSWVVFLLRCNNTVVWILDQTYWWTGFNDQPIKETLKSSLTRAKVTMDKYLDTLSLWGDGGQGQFQVTLWASFWCPFFTNLQTNSHTILASDLASCLLTDITHIPGFQYLLNSTFKPSPCFWPLKFPLHSVWFSHAFAFI